MVWFKADDQLSRSKKVLMIPRRYRMQSMGLWILAGTWSAGELTDGFVPSHMLDELGGTAAQAKRLVESGLWSEVAGGFQFNSWSDFQPSSNDVRARRARDAERKQKAREEKRRRSMQAADQGGSEGVRADAERTDRGVHAESTRSPQSVRSTRPDPTRPDPSLSMVTVSKQAKGSTARGEWAAAKNIPTELHSAANRALADGHPEQAILLAAQEWQIRPGHKTPGLLAPLIRDAETRLEAEAGQQRKHDQAQARRDAIANCDMCDPNGYILGLDDAVRCRHDYTANDALMRHLELGEQPEAVKGPF